MKCGERDYVAVFVGIAIALNYLCFGDNNGSKNYSICEGS
jgi:hypothetical protein